MVKIAHSIQFSAFYREDEDRFSIEDLQNTLSSFIPEDVEEEQLQKEGISLEEEFIKIDDGVNLTKLTLTFSKDRRINPLIKSIVNMFSGEQKKALITQENRVDPDGDFYIRLSLEQFVKEQEIHLTDGGDCLHIKFVLAAYPKNKQRALQMVKELFE